MDDLRSVFGKPLLNYLFARDTSGVEEAQLTGEQRAAAGTLRSWLAQLAGQPPFAQRISLSATLLKYMPEANTTVANFIRLACGGQIAEERAVEDGVLDLALQVGRDIYPGLLLPPSDEMMSSPDITAGVFSHPQTDRLCQAAYADEALKLLFPGEYPNLNDTAPHGLIGLQSEVFFSSGRGGGLQLIGLIESMFSCAYYRTLLAGAPNLEAYFVSLGETLQDIRKMATKKSCDVPVLIGLSGIDLSAGTAVRLPWGMLYSVDRIDSALLPSSAKTTAVLVTKRPLKVLSILRVDPADGGKRALKIFERYRSQMSAEAAAMSRIVSMLRLAFLLASSEEQFFAARYSCTIMLDPFQQTPVTGWNSQLYYQHVSLDAEAVARVQMWARKIKDHPKRLDVTMRRMVSAISDRTDPYDGFIDAVMAWENMFSGRPETNLRVCGAIAWLLKPDSYEQRNSLFADLKDLYTKRSNLVHGNDVTISDIGTCRNRAVRIAIDSLRLLYDDDRLLKAESSSVRGGMILLGAGQESETEAAES